MMFREQQFENPPAFSPEKPEEKSEEEKREKESHGFYKEQMTKAEKEHPDVCKEIKRLAKKIGFREVLIDPLLEAAARVRPEVFPGTIFWSKKSVEGADTLRKFAPEIASNGLKIITIHEREHLRGPAKEMIGAEEKFLRKGEWGNIRELSKALRKININMETQTRLQSMIALEKHKDLFKGGRPDIVEALATEVIFCDFILKGPDSLEKKLPKESYQEYLPFFKAEFVEAVREKDMEIRDKLLKDYRSWQKEQK